MSEQNPYESPEELSVKASPEVPETNGYVVRAIEYTIAILLIIALLFAFVLGIA